MNRLLVLAGLAIFLLVSGSAGAQTFAVTTTADSIDATPGDGLCADVDGQCSLRAAIVEANALPGRQDIILPAGIYALTRAGATENGGLSGDLDILGDLGIAGEGSEATVIDAAGIDRAIDIAPDGSGAASVWITAVTISGGSRLSPPLDSEGGGIRVGDAGTLELAESTVRGNTARNRGGGIANRGHLVVSASRIEDNTLTLAPNQSGTGAGLSSGGSPATFARLVDSIVRGNQLPGRGGGVAAIRNAREGVHSTTGFGELVIERSALVGNAAVLGGGLYADAPGSVVVRNSTISGNSADKGGGVFVRNERETRIEFSTITANSAETLGGGLVNVHGPDRPFLAVTGSILAGNQPSDIRGPALSEGFNLVESDEGAPPWLSVGGDETGVGALLGALHDPETGTPYHAPLPASPAIDAAGKATACPATDQRGVARPADGDGDGEAACDIGAIERSGKDAIFANGFEAGP